jgi:hypothetical protein
MLSRCYDSNNTGYQWYGGRGIRVCKRWHTYRYFLADMGRRPSPLHSLDRQQVNGNYTPTNCRWATSTEQNRNTTRNRHITIDGVTLTLAGWLEVKGLRRETFYQRQRRGMTEQEALTMPRQAPGRKPGAH